MPIEHADYSSKKPLVLSKEAAFYAKDRELLEKNDKTDKKNERKKGKEKNKKKNKEEEKEYQGIYTMEELHYILDNSRFFILRFIINKIE